MRLLAFLLVSSLICGCIGGAQRELVCWDGTKVTAESDCPKPTSDTLPPEQVDNASAATSTTTTLAPAPVSSSTTSSVSVTTTFRTTTTVYDPCGNGVLDEGEECDIGSVCSFGDGVCRILAGSPKLAVCMADGVCGWNTQSSVYGLYNMGSCTSCYGKNSPDKCRCIPEGNLVKTTQIVPSSTLVRQAGTTLPPTGMFDEYHFECKSGLCVKVLGANESRCMTDPQCSHKECQDGSCVTVNTPGDSVCYAAHGDCWHYACTNYPCLDHKNQTKVCVNKTKVYEAGKDEC